MPDPVTFNAKPDLASSRLVCEIKRDFPRRVSARPIERVKRYPFINDDLRCATEVLSINTIRSLSFVACHKPLRIVVSASAKYMNVICARIYIQIGGWLEPGWLLPRISSHFLCTLLKEMREMEIPGINRMPTGWHMGYYAGNRRDAAVEEDHLAFLERQIAPEIELPGAYDLRTTPGIQRVSSPSYRRSLATTLTARMFKLNVCDSAATWCLRAEAVKVRYGCMKLKTLMERYEMRSALWTTHQNGPEDLQDREQHSTHSTEQLQNHPHNLRVLN
ncbi:hypothetical protein CAPTEDRAFT_210520 [Capitella teleta]|uniref:Uncharacterized protein n=1 Tax=Capitella teleta TaxID=283909 RepID=R7VF44_CAPTE|nr:hypothetical protein CAPTEDRAFT_210520 [Capitella teleta]|eukprot:ELU17229.1 hypothetical protein CAPTEDRAFT_210520 [Capitella teleta]